MTGDSADFVLRLRSALPKRWFAEVSPNLNALLTSIATPWVWLYGLISYVISQSRIATASDEWLDLIGADYFGFGLQRKTSEADDVYRGRIRAALFRQTATRAAIISALKNLTAAEPVIFEPANCMDTGGYGARSAFSGSGLAYGQMGGWGSLNLPYQFFVSATRPVVPGVALLAGYCTLSGAYGGGSSGGYCSGAIGYVSITDMPGRVTDEEIQRALVALLPVNTVAWMQIH